VVELHKTTSGSRSPLRGGRSGALAGILAALLLGVGLLAAMSAAAQQVDPEAATGQQPKPLVVAERQLVVTANPYASEAAAEILRAGGSAADAAIAAILVLGLVEPQSAGLGGGGFWLQWDATAGRLRGYDGRETAPASARGGMFLAADGTPMDFWAAVASGRSVGVPGQVALLAKAYANHGRLPWADLFGPAIRLASQGFEVSPRLNGLLLIDPLLRTDPVARHFFYQEDGLPLPVGTVLRNPDYATILGLLAHAGPAAFYDGPVAAAVLAAAARGETSAPLALTDLQGYRTVERPVLCVAYRAYEICGQGPPTSGGVTLLEIFGVLGHFPLGAEPMAPADVHLLAEASRLAFADRNAYLADPDFVEQPVRELLDPGYLAQRAMLVDPGQAMESAAPGLPLKQGRAEGLEGPSTTHLVVVDRWGDVVSLTASIENAFGSRRMATLTGQGGFLLNNQLTDFSFAPTDAEGRAVANRVQAGKRPRSSMAPTIVLDAEGRPAFALGTPGGSRIIGFVALALVGLIDWGLDPAQAAALPQMTNRNGATDLEANRGLEDLGAALEALGHRVGFTEMASGLAILAITPDGIEGGADPRREGLAVGD